MMTPVFADLSTDDDEFELEVALDAHRAVLSCIWSRGLWPRGVPELYVTPPPEFAMRLQALTAELSVFLATGLMELGAQLMDADDLELPPWAGEFEGTPASVWLAAQEIPEGRLREVLPGVDTVIRVECSLWRSGPPTGQGFS